MSHTDYVSAVPDGFKVVADTSAGTCPVAIFENEEKAIYGIQFHPEVVHSEYGNLMLKNFLYEVARRAAIGR